MGCFFSIFKFGTYVVKESEPNTNAGSQVTVPEIRKHSSTPVVDQLPRQQKTSVKPLLADKQADKAPPKAPRLKNVDKEKTLYTTTFETQVDAAPPHPLEDKLQDIRLDEIEIDTNIFTPEVEDAVLKIQSGYRGYLARKHVNQLKKDIEDNALANDEELQMVPMVPPPKNFESQALSSFTDLDKWKKLSQHLEDKAIDVMAGQTTEESPIQPPINGPLTEAVIPLNDSNDNKVIETYVCKENILDVEPTEEQPVFSKVMTPEDAKVVDKVFNVLMSETESESIIDFIETTKSKIESSVGEPIQELVTTETTESEVLANLNAILDNNDSNDDNNQTSAEQRNDESFVTKVTEMLSQNTQQIISKSFQEFVKDMTVTQQSTDSEPKVKESQEVRSEAPIVESPPEQPKVEERKTDSMIFEDDVVKTIFGEGFDQNQTKNQIFAIELFKDDVKEEQLANVTTLCQPEPSVKNIWGVEDKVCKTSVDQFVVKAVAEPEPPVQPTEDLIVQTLESIPILDTEQKIEIISSQSRKNSEDLLESEDNVNVEPLIETEEEVLPSPSPIIQIYGEEEQNGLLLGEEEAAIRIQAAFRGYQIRRSMSREASPNRALNQNNHIDNNNNRNNGAEDDFEDNLQWIEPNLQGNNEFLSTNEVLNEASNQLMATSVEQIDTSLERLEDQLMQELICSNEEDDRTQALNDDHLDTQFLDEINSGGLSAPLLLQRIQQSMSSNASSAEPEEQVPEVAQIPPHTVPIDAQTLVEQQVISAELEDRPLIEKSDTIITDLMSSSPQTINKTVIDLNDTKPNLIQSDGTPIEDQLNDSQVIVTEESTDSPVIISEVLKDYPKPDISENKTEVNGQSSDPRQEPESKELIQKSIEAQPLDEPITQISEPQIIELIETQKEVIQKPEPISAQESTQQPIETQTIVNQSQELSQILIPAPIETVVPKVQEPISEPTIEPFPEPESMPESVPELRAESFSAPEPVLEFSESFKTESNGVPESQVEEVEPIILTTIEPPTPDSVTEITPELSFIQSSEGAVLTKICSSESEDTDVMSSDTIVESRPSMIPVLESNTKPKSGEQTETVFKRPKPILKDKDSSKVYPNIIPDEHTYSTSEDISSPDDENPEFVGLGPNTPQPVRASSPNPFGKRRRRGKKTTGPKK